MSVIWFFDPAMFFILYTFSLLSFTITSVVRANRGGFVTVGLTQNPTRNNPAKFELDCSLRFRDTVMQSRPLRRLGQHQRKSP